MAAQDIKLSSILITVIKSVSYGIWLLKEIAISAITVSKLIWLGKEIAPDLDYIQPNLDGDVKRVIYANSITLTPGTITVALEADKFLVHAIEEESLREFTNCEMAKRIRNL